MHSSKKIAIHFCYENNCGGETVATKKINELFRSKTVFVVSESISHNLQLNSFLNYFSWIIKSVYLHKNVINKQKHIDILYTTTFTGILGLLLTPHRRYVRVVYHYHGSRLPQKAIFALDKKYFTQECKYLIMYLLHYLAFTVTNLLIFPTIAAKNDLISVFPILSNKNTTIIKNGYDQREFYPITRAHKNIIRKELGIPQEAIVFLITGRMEPQKNILHALKLFERLKNKYPIFLVISYPKPSNQTEITYHAVVQSWVAKRPDSAMTLFLEDGYKKMSAAKLIGCANCVASFSTTELYPLTMIEAVACGVPYFSTNPKVKKLFEQEHLEKIPTWQQVADRIEKTILARK